jgi:glycosyltransferase involved in cell wall biosynthesis
VSGAGRPARVAFLINSLGTGGAERQLALTVSAIDRSRFEPVVVTLFRAGPFREEVEAAGVPVRDLGAPKSIGSAVRAVRTALRELRPDVVHTAMFEANVAGRLAARRLGVPAVSHATNTYESPERYAAAGVPRWKLRGARALERWTARRARVRVVAVGDAVARSAAAYLGIPASEVAVVRRGFDFAALERASQAAPADPSPWPEAAVPRLLAVGRLWPQKGLRFLVQAMPAILERHPAAHLAVAGEGPLRDELEGLVSRLGLQAAVTFAGVRPDVPALLARADAFVMPSLWEGAAGALVEAMGLGVPAAVTDLDALREVTGDDAERFLPQDAAAVVRAVDVLAADPEAARRRAAAAVPRVRAMHDLARNTRALEAVYDAALRDRSADPTSGPSMVDPPAGGA